MTPGRSSGETSRAPALRVALVGARCRRQGTGEYVARELARAGCRVAAIVGTSEATLQEARERLAARHGIHCRGYLRLEDLLAAEEVDAVAVCSPPEHHLASVLSAVEAGCHIFCEKPLWWEDGLTAAPAAEVEARAAGLVQGLGRQGRILVLNTQIPATLADFDRLHPGARARPPERFAMRMSPASTGVQAVVDSAPHLLSMLHALAGPGRIEAPGVDWQSASGGRLRLTFTYLHPRGATAVRLSLRRRARPPRPLSYAVDGHFVTRRIELPAYRIRLAARGRSIAVRDPLSASVDRFVTAARRGSGGDAESLVAGMVHLHQLAVAAARMPRQSRSAHGREAG